MNLQELIKVITPDSGINLKESYPEIYLSMLEKHIDQEDEILQRTEELAEGWKNLYEKSDKAVNSTLNLVDKMLSKENS